MRWREYQGDLIPSIEYLTYIHLHATKIPQRYDLSYHRIVISIFGLSHRHVTSRMKIEGRVVHQFATEAFRVAERGSKALKAKTADLEETRRLGVRSARGEFFHSSDCYLLK